MWMQCWHYCEGLGWTLFYATAPLLVLSALFAHKRARRTASLAARRAVPVLLALAAAKLFLLDPYVLRVPLACFAGLPFVGCSAAGGRAVMALGFVLFAASLWGIYRLRLRLSQLPPLPRVTPQQLHLRFWANAAFACTMLLSVWAAAPWVWTLAAGTVPAAVEALPWQLLGVAGAALLVNGFWRLEDCRWFYMPVKGRAHEHRVWTPRDTLWTALLFYLVAVALAYVTQDVLYGG